MLLKKFSPHSQVRKSRIFQNAKKICSILHASGYESYLVGGAVRDLWRCPYKAPKDIDIATSASPDQVQRLFSQVRFVGEAFAVCLVPMGEHCFEVASFRIEAEYIAKRKPSSIQMGTFAEDVSRRDFTCNALYFDPCRKIVKDVYGGIYDILQKKISCVGNPHARFAEDVLRILRAVRFSADLGFKIEPQTLQAMFIYSKHLVELPKERILAEFIKVKNVKNFVTLLLKLNVVNVLLPDILISREHSVLACEHISKIDNKFIFFKFLFLLFLKNKIIMQNALLQELEKWPLTRIDKKACQIFLKLVAFESLGSKKYTLYQDFIAYYFLEKTFRIDKKLSYFIFRNILLFLNNSAFFNKKISFENFDTLFFISKHTSTKIAEQIYKKGLEKHLIHYFILLFQFENAYFETKDIPEFIEKKLYYVRAVEEVFVRVC